MKDKKMRQHNYSKKISSLFARAKKLSKEKGIYYVVRISFIKLIFHWPITFFGYWYYTIFKPSRTFIFQGDTYNYFYHRYNASYRSERSVEIPIICKMLREYPEQKILEVGNVLSHYFSVNHDILDKYEKAYGVINQDVINFQPAKKYDLIVSISTLEHVGWDESPREPMKILQAIENLKNLLAPGGKMVITLPLGYNSEMDSLLKENKIQFTRMYYLKRSSRGNKWTETNWQDVVNNAKYNYSFYYANALVVGIFEKK
jgi:SAM-dependent methyltransferase